MLDGVFLFFILQGARACRSDARTGTGTLAYFFSTAELQGACCAAGFECSHVKYACVKLVNKRKQKEMNRVFVQGIFTKPR